MLKTCLKTPIKSAVIHLSYHCFHSTPGQRERREPDQRNEERWHRPLPEDARRLPWSLLRPLRSHAIQGVYGKDWRKHTQTRGQLKAYQTAASLL